MKLCSITIANWNGNSIIQKCLDAVFNQTYKNIEVIIVDNASSDGSADNIKQLYPNVILINNQANKGFAVAQNQAIRAAKGKYILCLNTDVILNKNFIETIINEMEKDDKIGSAACKLVACKNDNYAIIDSAGHQAYINRTFKSRGHLNVDRGQYDKKEFVFGTCGAAAVYRKEMLEDIKLNGEFFDESYTSYFEDIDLDWRAQIRGWKCLYIPNAVAIHESKSSGISASRNLSNRLTTIVKNDYLINFTVDLPFVFYSEISNLIYRYLPNRALLKGLLDFIKQIPGALKKRKLIQKRRVSAARNIRKLFTSNNYMINSFKDFIVTISLIILLIYYLGIKNFFIVVLISLVFVGGFIKLLLLAYSRRSIK